MGLLISVGATGIFSTLHEVKQNFKKMRMNESGQSIAH